MSNYMKINGTDIANGPGVRVSVFLSGCPHHCKGCFNENTWPENAGKPFTDQTLKQIIEAMKPAYIQGITILGGEPLAPYNQLTTARILTAVRETYGEERDVWVYTGYTWCRVPLGVYTENGRDAVDVIKECADTIVDGPFVESLKDITLLFRGSSNQRIIHLKRPGKA